MRRHLPHSLVVVSAVVILLMARLFRGGDFIVRSFKRLLRPLTPARPRIEVRIIHPICDFTRSVEHLITSRTAFYQARSLGLLLSCVELFQYAYALGLGNNLVSRVTKRGAKGADRIRTGA